MISFSILTKNFHLALEKVNNSNLNTTNAYDHNLPSKTKIYKAFLFHHLLTAG